MTCVLFGEASCQKITFVSVGQCVSAAQRRPTPSDVRIEQHSSNSATSQPARAIPLPEVKQSNNETPNRGTYMVCCSVHHLFLRFVPFSEQAGSVLGQMNL